MKIYKKIVVGTVVLAALVALFIAVPVKGALAATIGASDLTSADYTFLDGGNISVTIAGQDPIIFTDDHINSNPKYYVPSGTTFCGTGIDNYGITFADSVDLKGNPLTGTIHVGTTSGQNCTAIPAQTIKNIKNPSEAGATDFQWDTDTIISLSGQKDSAEFDPAPEGTGFSNVAFGEKGGGVCGYGQFILLNSANGNTGKLYELDPLLKSPSPTDKPLPDELKTWLNPGNCQLHGPGTNPTNISLAGVEGQAATLGGGGSTTSDALTPCQKNAFGLSLTWLACPLLDAADGITNALYNLFEGQLSFSIGQLGADGGSKVQQSWALMRDLSTGMIVIVTLIMVLSQAISFGPFDAYTVRKMLPRIIAAVILIQISWAGISFIIEVVNAVASGIADLMYFPFGGSDNMGLFALLGHAGLGTGEVGTISWAAMGIGIVLAAGFLPAMLVAALAAIIALMTALFVLIFRKILIITLVIFAPLALLAWVLPGTERYWKMWRENLLKVLFMFPLVVALIAAGRIFAYIVGAQGVGTGDNGANLLGFIFVMVGFFGPLFILPKTFKWGGQFMSMAGGAITSVGDKTRQAGKEPITGWTKRKVQGSFAKKYVPKGHESSTFANRTINSLLGGRVIPSKYRAAILTQSGDKWNEERDAEAQALMKRKGETAMAKGYDAAVLNDDKTGFAKYDRDASGNILGKDGNVAYTKSIDPDGKEIYHGRDGKVATDFDDAKKIDVDTFEEADKRRLTGVAAMKQMWVDLADESENKHERKMAIRQLTATSSWPEIQGSLSRKGNKVIDTEAWNSAITTSPEEYPRTLKSRVDATPHIDSWAKKQLEAEKVKNPTRTWTKKQEKDFVSQKRVLYSIRDQMGNEDFQSQSEGYWEEVARVANLRHIDPATGQPGELTKEAKDIQEALRSRFASIHDIGGTAPQQLLGHLVGGSVQAKVDKALGAGANISEYVDANTPLGGQTSRQAVADRWDTTIPTAVDLSNPDMRAKYKTSLLTTVAARGGGRSPSPVAKTLAEGIAYSTPNTTEQAEQLNLLHELRISAAASPDSIDAYNTVIDEIHGAYKRRADEIIQKAVASRTDPAEVARIRKAAEDGAAKAMASFPKL